MLEKVLELIRNPRILVTVIMGIIAVTLILPMYRQGKQTQDKKKRMRKKIKATATGIDRILSRKEEGELWINYVFTVDGKEYTGGGRYNHAEYDLFRKVTVYYNPENPAENCTNLERTNMGTAGGVLWLSVIAVILVLTYIFVK